MGALGEQVLDLLESRPVEIVKGQPPFTNLFWWLFNEHGEFTWSLWGVSIVLWGIQDEALKPYPFRV